MSALTGDAIYELRSCRLKAGWIDIGVTFAISAVFFFAVAGRGDPQHVTTTINGRTFHSTLRPITGGAWVTLGWLAACLAYFFLTEFLAGRTLGKWLMGVRVITVSGDRPSAVAVLLRTFGRVIDWWPFCYGIGWAVMNRRAAPPQRLGDWIAGTTVTFNRPRPR